MAELEHQERDRNREKSATEMAVELTIAWLKRVESTADGREPKEVADALGEFFQAIRRHQLQERETPRPVGVA